MVVIVVVAVAVVVRCYGERLSFKRSFFQTYFFTPWKARRGKRKYDNSHVPNLGGKLKSVSVCTRDIVDVYREEKVVTSRCHCSNISGCQQTKTSLKMWIRTVSNFIELT